MADLIKTDIFKYKPINTSPGKNQSINQRLAYLFPLILLIIMFEGAAQYSLKKSKLLDKNIYYFVAAVLSYIMVCIILFKVYDQEEMGITNALWSSMSIISITLIGVFFYEEKLYFYDYIGFGLILTGIYLIFSHKHNVAN